MSKMNDNHRYRPYYRETRRYDDDYKHQYKKSNKHHYQYSSSSSSRRDNRNYNDLSYRRSYRNDYHYQQTKPKSYSYFSSPPPPLMSTEIPPPLLPPPPPPPPPPQLLTVVPHERESWIRSVKKTKINESTEQKTQYLETMLRMPQQKSLLNSSKFDRMRFADDQLSTTTITTISNNDNLDNSSFHLIGDINKNDDIRTLEKILFDNELKQQQQKTSEDYTNHQSLPTPPQSSIESERTLEQSCSGFLIDNCDDEELPPLSPPPRPLLPPPPSSSSSDELIQQNDEDINQRRVMLVSELDAADAERKQELKRQKRLHQKLKKKTKTETQPPKSIIHNNDQESLSDWIIEYDINQVTKLTDEVRRTSITMTNEDKTEKVNLILMKIKKQQEELKKLRQYVMSMLGEQQKPKSSKYNRQNSNIAHDLLMAFLNQPTKSGCWLCSGKMYAEVATQCNHDDDDDEQ